LDQETQVTLRRSWRTSSSDRIKMLISFDAPLKVGVRDCCPFSEAEMIKSSVVIIICCCSHLTASKLLPKLACMFVDHQLMAS
jgi:hypothetical protein